MIQDILFLSLSNTKLTLCKYNKTLSLEKILPHILVMLPEGRKDRETRILSKMSNLNAKMVKAGFTHEY